MPNYGKPVRPRPEHGNSSGNEIPNHETDQLFTHPLFALPSSRTGTRRHQQEKPRQCQPQPDREPRPESGKGKLRSSSGIRGQPVRPGTHAGQPDTYDLGQPGTSLGSLLEGKELKEAFIDIPPRKVVREATKEGEVDVDEYWADLKAKKAG